MTAGGAIRLPNFMMPPLMNNHHCYIGSLGNVCRWLAPKAEALGVEIYPGFAAAEVLYDDKGAVKGIATGDMGIAKDGSHKDSYTRGMELLGKYTLFAEGARGSLYQAADREIFARRQERAAEIRHRPEGSLADRSGQTPEGPDPAFIRLAAERFRPAAARSSTTTTTTASRSASSCTSTTTIPICRRSTNSSASRPIPRSARVFEGGKRLAYGARAITEGGYQSVPRLTFPGGALVGCAAGFVNVPRIKGVHNAMGTGMLAAEHVAAALGAGRANDELVDYENAWRDSAVGKDLYKVRNVKPLWSKFGTIIRRRARRLRHVVQHAVRLLAVRHAVARQARPQDARCGQATSADRLSEAGRQDFLRQAVVGVFVQHQS